MTDITTEGTISTVDSWLKLFYQDLPKHITDPPATDAQLAAAFDRWHARTYKQWVEESEATRLPKFAALVNSPAMVIEWQSTPDGRAALITLCDAVGGPYVTTAAAHHLHFDVVQQLALDMVKTGELYQYSKAWQVELLMPFMHSESKELQQLAIDEYTKLDAEPWRTITMDHLAVLQRFGRFPYLHDADMTDEEKAWMTSDDIPLYLELQGHVDSQYHIKVAKRHSSKTA